MSITMNEWLDDFKMATGFLTRLPVPHPDGAGPANFARAYRLFPLVGALIGLAIGLFGLVLGLAGVPDPAAAALVLGAGTYGVIALLVSFAAKLSALVAIPDGYIVQSLIVAHALARGVLPVLALELPYARPDGLARTGGQPDTTTAMIACGLALLIALLSLSWLDVLWAVVAAGISGLVIARLALRQIGGQTGDVLGAAEQVAETAILVLLAARLA